jgi:hypothetical protein
MYFIQQKKSHVSLTVTNRMFACNLRLAAKNSLRNAGESCLEKSVSILRQCVNGEFLITLFFSSEIVGGKIRIPSYKDGNNQFYSNDTGKC